MLALEPCRAAMMEAAASCVATLFYGASKTESIFQNSPTCNRLIRVNGKYAKYASFSNSTERRYTPSFICSFCIVFQEPVLWFFVLGIQPVSAGLYSFFLLWNCVVFILTCYAQELFKNPFLRVHFNLSINLPASAVYSSLFGLLLITGSVSCAPMKDKYFVLNYLLSDQTTTGRCQPKRPRPFRSVLR